MAHVFINAVLTKGTTVHERQLDARDSPSIWKIVATKDYR